MLCMNYNARLAILDDMDKAVAVARSIAESNIGSDVSFNKRIFNSSRKNDKSSNIVDNFVQKCKTRG